MKQKTIVLWLGIPIVGILAALNLTSFTSKSASKISRLTLEDLQLATRSEAACPWADKEIVELATCVKEEVVVHYPGYCSFCGETHTSSFESYEQLWGRSTVCKETRPPWYCHYWELSDYCDGVTGISSGTAEVSNVNHPTTRMARTNN